jgi:protein-tyrosine phosphatase
VTVAYALIFLLLTACLVFQAILLRGAGWLLLWPALSFMLLAAAYGGLGTSVLGKRPDGRMAWWGLLLFLPYLFLTWVVWHLLRVFSRAPCCHEVAPGLWLGRRALAHELPPGVGLVVDLTAEFPEPTGVRTGRTYVSVPILDAAAPGEDVLRAVIKQTASWPGIAYVHCASGHGRSAVLAAAVLVRRGLARDAADAESRLRRARPGMPRT